MRRPVSGRDAIRSQVIDALEAQEIKETGNWMLQQLRTFKRVRVVLGQTKNLYSDRSAPALGWKLRTRSSKYRIRFARGGSGGPSETALTPGMKRDGIRHEAL